MTSRIFQHTKYLFGKRGSVILSYWWGQQLSPGSALEEAWIRTYAVFCNRTDRQLVTQSRRQSLQNIHLHGDSGSVVMAGDHQGDTIVDMMANFTYCPANVSLASIKQGEISSCFIDTLINPLLLVVAAAAGMSNWKIFECQSIEKYLYIKKKYIYIYIWICICIYVYMYICI